MKYSIIVFSVLVNLLGLVSCQSKEPQAKSKELIDLDFALVRLNKQGQNLLNPSTPNAISVSSVKTFYLVDGKKVEVNNPDMAAPRGVQLQSTDSNPNNNFFFVGVNPGKQDQEITTTYIQWSVAEVDTVQTLISQQPGLTFISKLWLNNQLKYEAGKTEGSAWGGAPIERLVIIQR